MRVSSLILCLVLLSIGDKSLAGDGPPLNVDAYERVLIPAFVPATFDGALGSRWQTELWLRNGNDVPVYVFQGDPAGCRVTCEPIPPVPTGALVRPYLVGASSVVNIGANLFIEKALQKGVSLNLKILELSSATNAGTEIPLIRENELRSGSIDLLNVPFSAARRVTLRVYDPYNRPGQAVRVTVREFTTSVVLAEYGTQLMTEASSGPSEEFADHPSFAIVQLGGFTANVSSVRVSITAVDPTLRFWAFVTVTDNASQHVTIVTPQ